MKKNILNPEENQSINNIKFGHFQLQTKSFWISIISIISAFILSVIYLTLSFHFKYMDRLLKHQEILIQSIYFHQTSSEASLPHPQ